MDNLKGFVLLSLGLLVLSVVNAAPEPFAGTLSVTWNCETCCIEGYPISFHIGITNPGLTNYIVTDYWVEAAGGISVAIEREVEYNLNREDFLDLFITTNITDDISNNTFRFRPCFEYKYWYLNHWEIYEKCASRYYNITAFLISDYYDIGVANICCSGEECEADEHCAYNYVCEDLDCGYCQYISNHACVSWDCCANEDCEETHYCANNTCLPVPCLGQIANHTCVGFIPPILPMLPGSDVVLDAIITFFGDNLILFYFGIVFAIVFIILLVWLFRGHLLPKKGPKDKKKKKEKKDKKKKKGKGEKEEPEFVPLVELPE